MSEENGSTEGGIKTPLGELSFKGKRTAEFITILSLLLLAVLATLYWTHEKTSEKQTGEFVSALKDLSKVGREQAQAQRMTSCLISLPQDKREREFASESSFCRQITR